MKILSSGFIIILLLFTGGCAEQKDPDKPTSTEVSVEWPDIVKWNDTKYYYDEEQTNKTKEDEVSQEIGKITFTVVGSKEETNSYYKVKNNEATFAEKGEKIYKLNNVDSTERIYVEKKVYIAK